MESHFPSLFDLFSPRYLTGLVSSSSLLSLWFLSVSVHLLCPLDSTGNHIRKGFLPAEIPFSFSFTKLIFQYFEHFCWLLSSSSPLWKLYLDTISLGVLPPLCLAFIYLFNHYRTCSLASKKSWAIMFIHRQLNMACCQSLM